MSRLRGTGAGQHGQALAAVLVAGVLLLSILLGLMLQSRSDLRRARNQADWEAAFYLAWSGVEHALAELNDMSLPDLVAAADSPSEVEPVAVRPLTVDRGTYAVTVTTIPGERRFRIRSTGQVGRERRRIEAVVGWRLSRSSYVGIWGAENYRISGNSIINGTIYSARSIELTGGTVVNGDAHAVESVNVGENAFVTGATTEGEVDVLMPEIDLSALQPLTTHSLSGSNRTVKLYCTGESPPEMCVAADRAHYIWYEGKGELWVQGTFTGQFVISSEGPIEIVGDIRKGSPNSLIAIVSEGEVTLRGGITCDCLLYSGAGEVTLPGQVTVNGAIIARTVNNSGNLFFNVDPLLDDLMAGLPGVRLVVANWREIP